VAHFMNVEWQKLHLGRLALAISTTSFLENALYHPWWVLKTREQVETTNINKGGVWWNSYRYAGNILKREGIGSLYRGFWAGSIGSLPSAYIYLVTYHRFKHELSQFSAPGLQSSAPFIAGVLAEVTALLLFVPIDVITQRLQIQKSTRSSLWVASEIVYHEGLFGLYRGTFLTGLKLGIGSGIWWLAYENTKTGICSITGKEPTVPAGILSGFIAGVLSTVVTNPLDVVKTRIQMQVADLQGKTPTRMMDGFKEIWLKEGWKGLNRGLIPKLVSQGPLSAFWAVIYEVVLKFSVSH